MQAVAKTDAGRVRETNEDSVFANPEIGLLMVADGMGGHAGGEIASNMTVDFVATSVKSALKAASEGNPPDIASFLRDTIDAANGSILCRVSENPELKGMGSTLVLALETGGVLHVANIGDSRAYLLDSGGLRQITQDHSLVAEMVRAGEISTREARKHHLRNYLTRSLGQSQKTADVKTECWNRGDRLLLCSDGLTKMVDDRRIEQLMTRFRSNLTRACDELIAAANSGGGNDNISVVIACPE